MTVRQPFKDERAYILRSWIDTHRYAPGMRNRRWSDYKRVHEPIFGEILDAPDTKVLLKVIEGDIIIGWICWTPGRVADALHWVFTRHRAAPTGAPLRRHGVMHELVEAAQLKPHLAFTFRGSFPNPKDGGAPVSSDEWLRPVLAKRGITAVYTPYKEWSAPR